MTRACPHEVFCEAHNGLNLFLTEYPHMDAQQKEEIRQLILKYSKPVISKRKDRRPALLCKVTQDGVLLIAPKFVEPVENSLDIS